MRTVRSIVIMSVFAVVLSTSAFGQWLSGTSVTVTSSSAVVRWTSCAPATGSVSYGTTAAYGSVAGSSTLATAHSVPLASLQPSTTYHFLLSSADATGTIVASRDATFTTSAAPAGGVTVTPTSLSFTAALNTDSVVKFVTLANPSASTVPGTSTLVGNGQFTWGNQGTCNGATLPPAPATCTISIKYHPTVTGTASGTLTTHSGSPSVTQVITLTGSTTVPPPPPPQVHPNLSWDPSLTPTVTGYNVWRSATSGGPYNKVNAALVNGTAYVDASAPSGTWFYVATAVDPSQASGFQESINSNQLVMVVP